MEEAVAFAELLHGYELHIQSSVGISAASKRDVGSRQCAARDRHESSRNAALSPTCISQLLATTTSSYNLCMD